MWGFFPGYMYIYVDFRDVAFKCTCKLYICLRHIPVHVHVLCVWVLSITIVCPPYVCGACPSLYVPYVCGACPSLVSFTVCSAPQVAKAMDQ